MAYICHPNVEHSNSALFFSIQTAKLQLLLFTEVLRNIDILFFGEEQSRVGVAFYVFKPAQVTPLWDTECVEVICKR